MIYREELLRNCPEDFQEELTDYLDRLEGHVTQAKKALEISVADSSHVNDCLNQLKKMLNALY